MLRAPFILETLIQGTRSWHMKLSQKLAALLLLLTRYLRLH